MTNWRKSKMKLGKFYLFFLLLLFFSCKEQVPDITECYQKNMASSKFENINIDNETFIQITWTEMLAKYFQEEGNIQPYIRVIFTNQDFEDFFSECNKRLGIPLYSNLIKTFYVGYDGKLGVNHKIYCNEIKVTYESGIELLNEVFFYILDEEVYIVKIGFSEVE